MSSVRVWCIAAPHSGSGKTSFMAALAVAYRRRGLRVRAFKVGPDFIDPMILSQATQAPVHNLDLWLVGESQCQYLLHQAANEADIILIEGVMGLFDGKPSTADLAARFGLPVLALIDVSAMAETFGAVAHGLATYRNDIVVAGIAANGVASLGHEQMLKNSLPVGLNWLGGFPRRSELALPERHLGLHQAAELNDLDQYLQKFADLLEENNLVPEPPLVSIASPSVFPALPEQTLHGIRIAVARDTAFSFLYAINLEVLEHLCATLIYFSPLQGDALPAADSIYLPGGYPELYAEQLFGNTALRNAIKAHALAGKPLVAECGGMMYLLSRLTTDAQKTYPMCGVISGHAEMQQRLSNLGSQHVELPEGVMRGHTFHYSIADINIKPLAITVPQQSGRGEAVYRQQRVTASYMHWYFPSNLAATVALFKP